MKGLKEQIIEALQDAIDVETGQVSISYFDALLDGVLTEALRIHDAVGQSEKLCQHDLSVTNRKCDNLCA